MVAVDRSALVFGGIAARGGGAVRAGIDVIYRALHIAHHAARAGAGSGGIQRVAIRNIVADVAHDHTGNAGAGHIHGTVLCKALVDLAAAAVRLTDQRAAAVIRGAVAVDLRVDHAHAVDRCVGGITEQTFIYVHCVAAGRGADLHVGNDIAVAVEGAGKRAVAVGLPDADGRPVVRGKIDIRL